MAVLGETAEVPLILKGYHRMLTFWNRTRNMEDDTLIKKAYMENVAVNSDWCKTIQILNSSQNLHDDDIDEIKFPGVARQQLRDNFTQYWKSRVSDISREKKLQLYAQIKQEPVIENYMDLPSFRDRQRITKFITSNHCLEIEKGRHENIPREQRLCKACESGATEDEEHFLFDCNAYTQLRQTHLNPQNSGQHCDNRLQQFFANHDPLHITTYLKTAYDLRDKIVNFHVSQVSMCGMKITLARGQGKHIDKPVTKLQTMMEQNNKLRISRKGKRHSPYP